MFNNFRLRTTGAFNNNENKFLKQMMYWCQQKKYGIEKDGRIWIYNTLDEWAKQLKVSKSSVQRTIRSLKEKGIIDSDYLSCNKRNRTLFYSINYDKLQDSSMFQHVVKNNCNSNISDHMVDHMYNKKHKQINNKSYKSPDNFSQKKLEVEISDVGKQKNTTVQDMMKVFNQEFSNLPIQLNKNVARNFVAAFKLKFENSLEKWKEFISLVKTSTYLMSEKFKLTVNWLLKFSTIDRLKNGELGVKIKEFFTNEIQEDEWNSRAEQQIAETDEPEEIKSIRKKISEKITPAKYIAWFKNVKFLQKNETFELIYPNKFIEDNIKLKFSENFNFINI